MKNLFFITGFLFSFALSAVAQFVDPTFSPKISGVPKIYTHEVQSDRKILLSGNFVRFNNKSVGSVIRVNPDGTLDNSFTVTDNIGSTIIDRIEQMSENYIIVTSRNQGGSWVLNMDGSLKTNIDKEISKNGSYNYTLGAFAIDEENILLRKSGSSYEYLMINIFGEVNSQFQRTPLPFQNRPRDIAIQNDGKIVIAGYHHPIVDDTQYAYLTRLNSDGTKDETFDIGTGLGKSYVDNIEIDNQGRIYVCGSFDSINDEPVPYDIIRLFPNGSLDNSFSLQNIDDYPDLSVSDIEIMPDGSLIIVGVSYAAQAQVIIKINDDGLALDAYEKSHLFPHYHYRAELEKHGNEISVSGIFHSANGQDKYGFIFLNKDGSIKRKFDLPLGSMATITSTILQDNGKIMIGGSFSSSQNVGFIHHFTLRSMPDKDIVKVKNMARLNPDGTIDDFVTPFQHDHWIESMAQLKNGQYLVSGRFRSIGQEGLLKLNNDGSIDDTFSVSYFGQGSVIKLTNTENVLIGGSFKSVNGIQKTGLAKIDQQGKLIESFNVGNVLPESYTVHAIDSLEDGSLLIGGYFGSSLKGYVWKIDKNATEVIFKLEDLPYYFIDNFSVLSDRILVSGGSGNPPCPVLQIDFEGNIINGQDFALSYDDPLISDYLMVKDDEFLIGGRFDEINGSKHIGLAKASLTGVVDQNYKVNISGYRSFIKTITRINSDSAYISGRFDGVNNIRLNSIAKVRISNIAPPKIISQLEIPSIDEDSEFEILIKTMEIVQRYDIENSNISIHDGDNYKKVNNNKILPEINFNGELEVVISVLDGTLESDQFLYTINVIPVNDAPVIVEQIDIPNFTKDAEFHIEKDMFIIEDPDNDHFEIHILEGDNYSVTNRSILVSKEYEENSIHINVEASDGELNSPTYSAIVNLKNSPITSISTNENLVEIYPIPSNDFINVDFSGLLSTFNINMHDLSGKEVYSEVLNISNPAQIDINHLQKGIYFLTLTNQEHTISKKIIKN